MIRRRNWESAGMKRIMEEADLRDTSVSELRFPNGLERALWFFFQPEKLTIKHFFHTLEQEVRKEADSYYAEDVLFREVGGYAIIKREQGYPQLRILTQSVGPPLRREVRPGKLILESWVDLPAINELGVNLYEIDYFIRYHSHPIDVTPSRSDVETGVQQFLQISATTRYLQAIYTKGGFPEFLWWEHHKS